MLGFLCTLLTPQLEEARRFWKNKQIRTALIVPWAEAFTAAFLTPVLPFFLQGLGLRATEMGQLRTVSLILNACSAPFVGWLLDHHGPFIGIALPSSLCAIGCTIRALATGYSSLLVAATFSGLSGAKQDMSIAHTVRHTPPARRTLAVSAANVQVRVLTLLGTACFTPLNKLLSWWLPASHFGMLRFRLLLSLCTIGCGFGVIVLLFASRTLAFDSLDATDEIDDDQIAGATRSKANARDDEDGEMAERGPIIKEPSSSPEEPSSSPAPTPPPIVATGVPVMLLGTTSSGLSCGPLPAVLVLSLSGLFICKYLNDALYLTWPLFIKAHFGWAESEYALLLPMQQALAFLLVATPWVHMKLGSSSAVLLLGGGSLLSLSLTYLMQSVSGLTIALHVVSMLLGGVANSALELILTALASTHVPPTYQGRLFAALAVLRCAGSASGNLLGSALFQYSLDMTSDAPLLVRGGALPITLMVVPAALNLLALTRCITKASSSSSGAEDERSRRT